jgi:16S rRNA (adenine1518-N6/adenine1519-N6)-dimethyltransferase
LDNGFHLISGHSITSLKREHQRGERKRSEQEPEQFLLFFFEVFEHGGIFFQDAKIQKRLQNCVFLPQDSLWLKGLKANSQKPIDIKKMVKAKKRLGQHFLNNQAIAQDIADAIRTPDAHVMEIGPGMGVLTQYLLQREFPQFAVIELDEESVEYLQIHYPELGNNLIHGDFLQYPLSSFYEGPKVIVGNFPYNISSQILFKVLDEKETVVEVVGMFQKEVAERVCAHAGNKQYGILSVLLQAFYDTEYLFTVGEHEFTPPPQVKSAVIRLIRNFDKKLNCDEKTFRTVVKTAFNYRRKTLRNALQSLPFDKSFVESEPLFTKRAEQLSLQDYEYLTGKLR